MACPKCGCKVTYQYGEGDGFDPYDDQLQRCGGCGNIFDIEDSDEAASSLLQHSSVALTKRHYRSKATQLKPVR